MYRKINYSYSIIRDPTTPERHQSQSRQNEQNAHDLGSPENRRTPVPPSQGIIFNGQQYNNLPEDIVLAMQGVQNLEQASTRTRGSSSRGQGNQTAHPTPQVGYHQSQMYII
jgi:hypothetical protein